MAKYEMRSGRIVPAPDSESLLHFYPSWIVWAGLFLALCNDAQGTDLKWAFKRFIQRCSTWLLLSSKVFLEFPAAWMIYILPSMMIIEIIGNIELALDCSLSCDRLSPDGKEGASHGGYLHRIVAHSENLLYNAQCTGICNRVPMWRVEEPLFPHRTLRPAPGNKKSGIRAMIIDKGG